MQSSEQQYSGDKAGEPKTSTASPVKRRGWWRRNWWKLALTVVLVPLLGGAGFVAWRFGPVMFSKPYRMAYHELGISRQVLDQLGEPLSGSWLPTGSVDSDSARFYFEIWGPKAGKTALAHVAVQARYMLGEWGFTQFDVTMADGHRLNLLDEIASRLKVDTPVYDPKVPQAKGVTVEKAPENMNIEIPDVSETK